jgi:hypothetical protein
LRFVADALASIPQKKALLYFAPGLGNGAQDTPAELRAAVNAATRANLAVYPMDTRGLQAVIPNGPARIGSRGGEAMFSGRGVDDQFAELTASQDMMASIASSTGGRMFSGTNDLGGAFARAQRDTAAYYLLGYSSTNPVKDGRFRRVEVRVRREGLHVEARAGYYAERDFAHTSRADRELQLEGQLAAAVPAGDYPVGLSAGWVRDRAGQFRVPIDIWAPPLSAAGRRGREALDVLAVIDDEQGRPVARVRDTIDVPMDADNPTVPLTYRSSVTLPAGTFLVRAVMRENGEGATGTASVTLHIPLATEGLSVSGALLHADAAGTLTVSADVYGADAGTSTLLVSITVFKDDMPIASVPLARTPTADASEVTSYSATLSDTPLESGRYTCQITVVDPASQRFATSRTEVDVR